MPRRGIVLFIMPIFVLAWFFVFGASAKADSVIISQDTIWSKGEVRVIDGVDGLVIMPNVKLTVEAGAIIKLAPNNSIVVMGELDIQGSTAEPVIITSLKDDSAGGDTNGDGAVTTPAPGDWYGIIANDPSVKIKINYAKISYGGSYYDSQATLVAINQAAEFSVEHSSIINNNGYIIIGQAASAKINYSNIYNPDFCLSEDPFGMGIAMAYCGGPMFINTDANLIDAANNYWGHDSGPTLVEQLSGSGDIRGTAIGSNIAYQPYLTAVWAPEVEPAELEPVIIVPGVMGSDLINASDPNDKIWLDINRVIGSLSDDFLSYLEMDNNGNTINAINVGDVIREIKVSGVYNSDVLKGLISYLQTNGYQENENLFVFPYDWRQSIDLTATQLNQKILDVLSQTGAQKVNIIAHSLGGLVTKDYIKKYTNQNKINKFIDIATPHFGAPNAFKTLKYGDDFGFRIGGLVFLNSEEIKIISQNMPSIYEALPSAAYYDSGHIDYNFIYSDQGHNYDYEDINTYLKIWHNPILVNEAKEFHSNIDDYNSYNGDTKTYNIIGCGFATLGKIIKLNQEKDHNEYRIDYVSGDGTVPLKSAEGLPADKKYYYDGVEHMSLPSANGVTQLVGSILDGEESQFDLSPYPMSDRSNICQIRGKLVTYHSPIALNAYDEYGNHVGPNESGDIDNQIPGAQYEIIEDNKFVFLPAGHIYRIEGQATGLGVFNSRVETIDNGIITQTAYYNQIPITTSNANVEMTVMDNQTNYTMKVDQDGDKTFETTVQPSSILDKQESADMAKPETTINISGTQGNDDWYVSPVQISFTATDNEGGSGILKTEYSLDNGLTWQVYTDVINLDKQGVNKILFKSTDRAGNIEEEKILEFKIDSISPTIEMIAPMANDEYDHAESLEVLYNSIDSVSGLDDLATKMQIDGQDISTASVELFPYHLGIHQLNIKTVDLAGNQTATTVPFSVITSIPGMVDDIKKLYFEKQIIKVSAKDDLIKELNSLQQYLERFGARQDKRLSKYQERLIKCDKRKKHADDCQESVKKLYERHEYVLNKTQAKIVADRFANLLKDLDKYYFKRWLTPRAYEMIKEELIYLKNNL